MRTEATRGVKALGDQHDRVRMTLLAHAESNGDVRGCSWTKLMDFAGISGQAEAERLVADLERDGLVRRLKTDTRSPHFRVIGATSAEKERANGYYLRTVGRVNEIRNARAKTYVRTKHMRQGDQSADIGFAVENLREDDGRADNTRKWSFDLRIEGCGALRNCVYLTSPAHALPFIGGPRATTREGWKPLMDFEKEFADRLRAHVTRAIDDGEAQNSA